MHLEDGVAGFVDSDNGVDWIDRYLIFREEAKVKLGCIVTARAARRVPFKEGFLGEQTGDGR